MKKLLLIIAVLLMATGVTLWLNGKETREIVTEIDISAPPATVWRIVANVEDWAEWSPIINQSNGTASMGSTLNITMMGQEPGEDGPNYSPVMTVFDEPKTFRWRAKMLGGVGMTNDKLIELHETNSGTRLVHKELFSGMVVPVFWSNVEKNVPAMLNSMNAALKTKAEVSSN